MLLAASIGTDLLTALLQGTPPGTVYALIALGFVLAYKTSGVFNLAFGAQAFVAAAFFFQAHTTWGWSTPLAFVVAVFVLSPAIGLILERAIFRRLRSGSSVAKLIITIGLSVAIPAIYSVVFKFEANAGQTP